MSSSQLKIVLFIVCGSFNSEGLAVEAAYIVKLLLSSFLSHKILILALCAYLQLKSE